jgi:hypothetical protein
MTSVDTLTLPHLRRRTQDSGMESDRVGVVSAA